MDSSPTDLPQELLDAAGAFEEPVEVADSTQKKLSAYVNEMIYLKRQIDAVESDLTDLKQRYDDIRKRQLPDLMQTEGLIGPDGKGRFTHDSGARVHLTHKVRASYLKSGEEDFFRYLRLNGHGALIKETIHAQTLASFAKELMENGEPLPPELSAHVETSAVITLPKQGEL